MKRIFFYLFLCTLTVASVAAQQKGPNISWETENIDFGTIKEEDGKVTKQFNFTNTGSSPLVLTHVRPSCGCTSSNYTKEPILPGQSGYVEATFDPAHRPGKFNKSITVTTNTTPANTVVHFHGTVTPRPKTLSDEYPRKIGALNLESNHIALMKVYNTEVKTESLGIANTTEEDLTVTFRNVPSYMTIKAVPQTLKPGEKGNITVSYDASKKEDWGFVIDRITLAVNDDTDNNRNKLSVSATIEEDFSKLSETDKANAAHISFENKVFNFGELKQGESVDHAFTFINDGKSDLVIRKTKASCGCTVVNPEKTVIKPGESSKFEVTFRSAGKKNRQNKSITVITNDPQNPQITLRVTGNVVL